MKDSENIRQISELPVDWMGFIFWKESSRFVAEKPDFLPVQRRIGVFVNAELPYILAKVDEYGLGGVQLHGGESPIYCNALRAALSEKDVLIIKAISIATAGDIMVAQRYQNCDYLIFDTKCPELGGSGRKFDWRILDGYFGNTPFVLSGGIDADSIDDIRKVSHPKFAGIDLNSRFEVSPGVKDYDKLRFFLNKLNYYE